MLHSMPPVREQKVEQTAEFRAWLSELADEIGKAAIVARIVRMEVGLMGDVKSVGGGVSEARIDVGPGYRVYYHRRGLLVILLLTGGDKSSQSRDIERAREMAARLRAAEKPKRGKGKRR